MGSGGGGTAPGSVLGAETTRQELQLLEAAPWAALHELLRTLRGLLTATYGLVTPHTEGGKVSLLSTSPSLPWGHFPVFPAHAAGATQSLASAPAPCPSPAPNPVPVLLPPC